MNYKPNHDPVMMPIPHAVGWSGRSRTTIYRLAAAGHIRLVKAGARTLLDCASMRAYLASLPEASIGKRDAA
jgi:hypothetical protein